MDRFYDKKYGGAYISISAKGEVLNDAKPNYCEAFLLMGCAAYAWAAGNEETLRVARRHSRLWRQRANLAHPLIIATPAKEMGR